MKYKETHPWISFSLPPLNSHEELWLLLGEAKSKCEQIANSILEPELARYLQSIYLAKGALATNAIEGNTLTEADVIKQVQEEPLELPPSQEYLAQETDNIISACNQIAKDIKNGAPPMLTLELIKGFNRLVLHKLKLQDRVIPGEVRTYRAAVANRYEGPPAAECEYLLNRLCDWLNKDAMFQVPTGKPQMALVYATLKAVLVHLYIAWIHPFGDGNGRTARLLEFFILLASNVPAPAAHLLSNHYSTTRSEYYLQLDNASKSGGNVIPFLTYAVQGFVDGMKSQLKAIWTQQWEFAWNDYVHHQLPEDSTTVKRRRHLVLALSSHTKPVTLEKILEISPKVALEYAKKHPRTLSRDLARLMEMGLIKFGKDGYYANRGLMFGMLPFVAKPNTSDFY